MRWCVRLLTEFGEALTPEIRQGISDKGLTIDEAVIIASIVEREAVLDEERPRDRGGLHEPIPQPRQRQTRTGS